MPLSANIRACVFMSLSMAGFTFNDALVKTVMDEINTGQIMAVRGMIIIVCLAAYLRAMQMPLIVPAMGSPAVIARTATEVGATILFLLALANMPLANASAVLQVLPLTVALGAALFLGEPIGWRRISAIIIGFFGVLLIIRPGVEGFNAYSVVIVGAVFFLTIRDLVTRRLPTSLPSVTVSLLTAVAVTAMGLALVAPMGGWQPMRPAVLLTLVAAAGFLFVGYQCVILAMRQGDIALAAPFRYTALLWAILLGIVILGEIPDTLTLAGAAIVVVTGIFTLYRERIRSAQSPAMRFSAGSTPSLDDR